MKNIMFVGTGSSAGKSLINAAFCRIFVNEGYKVKPFKSQNMALNSYITKDGFEMGRAQVMQSEAAKIEPDVKMNPILLKPTCEMGSQVILMGKAIGNLTAENYYRMKPELKGFVMKEYKSLSKDCDIIVIEGAGSPAEINLRDNDFVNMGLAEMIDAPVIIVADIDKGGVFASIYGTIKLLEPHEQRRIKGFIINKFRGDKKLLEPGIKMIEEKVKKPCLGVVPWIKNLNIDDEDSVTERFNKITDGDFRISVVKLPYISNFTDFNVFELMEGVSFKYANTIQQLNDSDLIIIPGSKNTIKDLAYLYETGMADAIKKLNRHKVPVIGICGGYQMLGLSIKDPKAVESSIGEIIGLGLLNIETIIESEKTTVQTQATVLENNEFFGLKKGMSIKGYEIHMGITNVDEKALFKLENGTYEGSINPEKRVWGTYLHGVFDNDSFRNRMIKSIADSIGVDLRGRNNIKYAEYKDNEYEKLAKIVKESVNYDAILSMISK